MFNTAGLTTDPTARERWWDPSDPRVFVPRAIGIGWDINFGALAVKLGWVREDDFDDDVISAIPCWYHTSIRTLPVVATGALAALTLARKEPHSQGIVNLLGSAAVTGFALSRQERADQLVTSSLAAGISTALVGQLLADSPTGQERPSAQLMQVATIFGLPLGLVAGGIKLGLRHVVSDTHSPLD